MEYQETYGRYNRPPDLKRCAAKVWGSDVYCAQQCSRKAVCDPDHAGNPTTCKQHSAAVNEKKKQEAEKRTRDSMRDFKLKNRAPLMLFTLQQIAEGHNNPRSLAQETIDKCLEALK